jgi:hypothetical protein
VISVLSQDTSQVILENVERAFGLGRIVPIAGQHFDALALARNNASPVHDKAKSHFQFARPHR